MGQAYFMGESSVCIQRSNQRGFVLVFSIILALVILTSLGLWYQQIIIQGFLGERLIHQRSLYVECRSLLPILIDELDKSESVDLEERHEKFMNVSVKGQLRWVIDRSELVNNKIRFIFNPINIRGEALKLTIKYEKKSN